MIKFKNKITIHSPRKHVFDFLIKFEKLPLWNYYIIEVRQKSSGKTGVGAIYRQTRKDSEHSSFKVSQYKPVDLLEIQTVEETGLQFKRTFMLSGTGEKTLLEDRFEVDTGSPLLVEWMLKARIKNAVAENLRKMKELLETRKTRLQDGRIIHL